MNIYHCTRNAEKKSERNYKDQLCCKNLFLYVLGGGLFWAACFIFVHDIISHFQKSGYLWYWFKNIISYVQAVFNFVAYLNGF